MQIILNGEETILESDMTIADLIKKYQLSPQKVAIELNYAILPLEEYQNTRLSQGDKIEIVEFVGGG